jgi:hypothetical protein
LPEIALSDALRGSRVVAVLNSYDQLHRAIRDRADELKVTRQTIDAVAGTQEGYAGKILGPGKTKRLGHVSWEILPALGIAVILVEDTKMLDQVRDRLVEREQPPQPRVEQVSEIMREFGRRGALRTNEQLSPERRTENARKRGKARAQAMTPAELRASAQRAARARWSKTARKPKAGRSTTRKRKAR